MQYGTFLRSAQSPQRLCALLAAVLLLGGLMVSSPASQAGAAETPATPLGVGARSHFSATDTFAGEKLGIDAASGQSLWTPSAPRVIADVDSGAWYDAADDAWTPQPSYDEGTAWEEEAYEPAYEPSYDEDTYEEPVYEEPQVIWDSAVASAYSPECNGGTVTSSGIPLDWETPTVASTWIPLGSYIEIAYDGMTVVAQVTDRGPYIAGRELDLAPGVIYAFGFGSTDDWGVRTVSYRLL